MFLRTVLAIAVFLFVSWSNSAHAAGGVEVLIPESGVVSLIKTDKKTPIPVPVREEAKKLDAESSEYSNKVLVYLPGYLGDQKNQDYVIGFVLSKWNAWKKTHKKATLVVCSRFPPWCRIFPADEVKDLTSVYQTELNSAIKTRFFDGIGMVLAHVNKDLLSRDEAAKARMAAKAAEEAAIKAAEAEKLRQEKRNLLAAREVLSARIKKIKDLREEVSRFAQESLSTVDHVLSDAENVLSHQNLLLMYQTSDSLSTFAEILEVSLRSNQEEVARNWYKRIAFVIILILLASLLFRLYSKDVKKSYERALHRHALNTEVQTTKELIPSSRMKSFELVLCRNLGKTPRERNRTFALLNGFQGRAAALFSVDAMSPDFQLEVFKRAVHQLCADWASFEKHIENLESVKLSDRLPNRVEDFRQTLNELPDSSYFRYFLQGHPFYLDYTGKMKFLAELKRVDPHSFSIEFGAIEYSVATFETSVKTFIESLRKIKALKIRLSSVRDVGIHDSYLTPVQIPGTWFHLAEISYKNLLRDLEYGTVSFEKCIERLETYIKLCSKGMALCDELRRAVDGLDNKHAFFVAKIGDISRYRDEFSIWTLKILNSYEKQIQEARDLGQTLVAEKLLEEALGFSEYWKMLKSK